MDQTTQTIINAVTIFLSSSVGATVLGTIFKAIIEAIKSVKTKKYSILTESDKKEIAKMTAGEVIASMKDGVHIDVDAMIDRATNKRLALLESKNNEFAETMNSMIDIVKAEGSVLCELKTPSQGARGHLQELIGNVPKAIEYLPTVEQPVLQIKQAEDKENASEPTERKFMY